MNMNYLRYTLYGLLLLLGLSLFNLWQKEHPHQVSTAVSAPTSPEESHSQGIEQDVSLPKAAEQPPIFAGELSAEDIVTIKTDVMNAKVDLRGGHLVDVSLPVYPESVQQPNMPYQLLSNKPNSFYIAQSGIRSINPPHEAVIYKSAQNNYSLGANEQQLQVVLTGHNKQGIEFTKTYTFHRNNYVVTVEVSAKNQSNSPWLAQGYEQLLRRKQDTGSSVSSAFHFNPFMGVAYSTQTTPYQKLNFKKLASTNLDVSTQSGWVAMLEHYFLSAWIPATTNEKQHFYTQVENDLYSIGVLSSPEVVGPGKQINQQSKLYVGPLITSDLQAIAPHLDLTVDYGWLWIISEALFWLLSKIESVIGNWGWSIVIVTMLVKMIFYKLSASSYRSMAAMRALQPRIQALRERYGDDKQKINQAMMEIYRKEKINPLGGCLPMLVQIPVFLALYWVLFSSVELRQAPFILWIKDLSIPDPYYVLPVLMGLSMFVQQRLSPAPADPTQAKVMMFMPVVLTLFFLNFPAGLVLYWVVNNTLSILQQAFAMRHFEKKRD